MKQYCQRYSNNSNPTFADQGIMTIYLFAGRCQKYSIAVKYEVKAVIFGIKINFNYKKIIISKK